MISKSGFNRNVKQWINFKLDSISKSLNKENLNNQIKEETNGLVVTKSIDQMPGPKPSLPLIGTGWQYYRIVGKYDLYKLHDVLQQKFSEYGPIFKEEYQRGKAIVNICSPKDIETVFRSQGKCPIRPANDFVIHYRMKNKDKYESVGIANMNGQEWYRNRQLLAPALLKLDVIQHYIPNLDIVCNDFIKYIWKQSHYDESCETFFIEDFRDISYDFSLESISSWCLDTRLGCLWDNQLIASEGVILVEATKNLFQAYQKLFYSSKIWKFFKTQSYKQLDRAETTIYDTLAKYVDSAIHKKNVSKCLVNELLKLDTLSVNEIKVTLMDFIIGGLFTVSNALNFVCYHLARNQNIQQKLSQEINQVMNNEKVITQEKLSQMTYLKACIKESFRLTSTIPGIMRILPNDIQLSGYSIPAGTLIFANFMTTCRSEKYFSEPEKFIPERWIGEEKNKLNAFAMIPFGFGNRMCAGRRFAQLHIEMAVVSIIREFELSIDTCDQIELICNFLIVPNRQIKLKFNKRI